MYGIMNIHPERCNCRATVKFLNFEVQVFVADANSHELEQ
jgi:hypothetical protein